MLANDMLVFTAPPATTNAGVAIDSPGGVQVTVETSSGVPITTNSDSITVSIGTNPGNATLGGTLTASAVSGVATFSTLTIANAVNGYTLWAKDNTTASTSSATSPVFNIDAIPSFITLGSLTASPIGYYSQGDLVRDSSGNLYGTTFNGGAYGFGSVFELSGTGYTTVTSLASFTNYTGAEPGANPYAGLVIDSTGNLYGTTSAGGTLNDGTIFELSGSTHTTFTSLVSFTGTSGNFPGQAPEADLTVAGDGTLYGTTTAGGTSGNGVAFSLSGVSHNAYSPLFSFTGNSGIYPGAGSRTPLTFYNGAIFGGTRSGGSVGEGNVFELSGPSFSTFTNLVNFSIYTGGDTGFSLAGNLVFDSSGDLFGATSNGGAPGAGNIFELSGTNYSTFTNVISLTGNSGKYLGATPYSGLVADGGGNFYGTTASGGSAGDGTVFELSGTGHTTFTSLVSFSGTATNVKTPYAGVILDSSGDIFGTSQAGGANNVGTVFELPALNRSVPTVLYSLSTGSGAAPSPFIQDSSGNLYGTTPDSGAFGDGTVFELSGTNHSVYTTLITFTGNSGSYIGAHPTGISFDSSGNMIGTTYTGGLNGDGSIFELSGATHTTFTSLFSLTGTTGSVLGFGVDSGLVLDPNNGSFYGSTITGGVNNLGTAFAISGTAHNTFTSLVSFTGTTGSYPGEYPRSAPVPDTSDNLYGTTSGGGAANYGTVYELSGTSHTTFTSLIAFNGSSGTTIGAYPDGAVIFDSTGNIFGTAVDGGNPYGDGMVYELAAPAHNILTRVVAFTGTSGNASGGQPVVALTAGSNGIFYGDTSIGGTNNDGTVFSLSGANHSTFSLLASFTGNTGFFPGRDDFEAVMVDGAGNIYGTTPFGGSYGSGSIYELPAAGASALNQASGSVTIASATSIGSTNGVYFNSISAGAGAIVAVSPNFSAPFVLASSAINLAGATNAWTGTLDLANNDLDVPGASLATITNQILEGFNNGNWTGQGIVSSSAQSSISHLTALGVIQNNQSGSALFTAANPLDGFTPGVSDVLVKYTYYGDANLDGKVDGSDYTRIDSGYLTGSTGWYNGDFNYDGVVNGSDYTLIDNAFNRQGASLAAQVVPTSKASRLVSSAAQPTQYFSQTLSVLQSSWATPPNSIAAQLFSPDTRDLINHQKFSNLQILA